MQPLSLLSCGLFISSLCSSTGTLFVFQTPPALSVKDGDSVSLTCCWNKAISEVKVKWVKESPTININRSDKLTLTQNETCSVLSIRHFSMKDSGLYTCTVTQDIPTLITVKGNGTMVKRDTKCCKTNESEPSPRPTVPPAPDSSLLLIVGVSVPVAVVLICLCVSVAVWRTCKKSERLIIREGPPSEVEEPEHSEGEDSSRNSRGSTQWYMVPVYESYFDLQRNDEEESSNEDQSAKSDKKDSLGKSAKAANHK